MAHSKGLMPQPFPAACLILCILMTTNQSEVVKGSSLSSKTCLYITLLQQIAVKIAMPVYTETMQDFVRCIKWCFDLPMQHATMYE